MAKQRYINTKFWSDSFVVELNPLDRYLFLYLLTNEHTNIAGIYELPIVRMAQETGLDKEMLSKMMKRLGGKIAYSEGWVIIRNFQKHQKRNESVLIGIGNVMAEIPSKIKVLYQKLTDTPQTPPRLGTDTELSKPESISESKPKPESISKAGALQKEDNLNPIIELFKEINPSYERLYSNKTQRAALKRLVDKFGAEKVSNGIKTLPSVINQKYAPRITTPLQLEQKMGELVAFLNQQKAEPSKLLSKISFN